MKPIGGFKAQRSAQAQKDCCVAQPQLEHCWCLALPAEPFDLCDLPHLPNRVCSGSAQSSEQYLYVYICYSLVLLYCTLYLLIMLHNTYVRCIHSASRKKWWVFICPQHWDVECIAPRCPIHNYVHPTCILLYACVPSTNTLSKM